MKIARFVHEGHRARGVNLKDGDLVEVEIDGIGVLRNRVMVTR